MADPLDILTGRVSRESGDDIGSVLATLANTIASIPERRARAAERRAQLETEALNADTRAGNLRLQQDAATQKQALQQKAAQLDQTVNQIVKEAFVTGQDGVKRIDRNRITEGFARGGVPLDVQAKALKSVDELEESGAKFNQERNEHKARVINAVLESPDVTQGALLAISDGVANGWLSDEDKQGVYALLASGQDPRPALTQMRDSLSDKYKSKNVKLGPGDVLVPEQGGKPVATNPKPDVEESAQSKSVLLDGKPSEVIFKPKSGKFYNAAGEDVSARVKPMPPSSVVYPQSKPDRLIKVEHKGADGRTVIEWLPESQVRGQTFEKGIGATMEGRLASAQTVAQTGADIINMLSDPKVAAQVGPAMGRFNTLRDFIGNPPPDLAELAGSLESYALSSMGVHGMRSVAGAQQIKDMLDKKHTPESLIKTIQGLNKFSQHFMETQGREAPTSKPHAGEPLSVEQIKAVAEKRKQTYAEAKADAEALGYIVK